MNLTAPVQCTGQCSNNIPGAAADWIALQRPALRWLYSETPIKQIDVGLLQARLNAVLYLPDVGDVYSPDRITFQPYLPSLNPLSQT